MLLKKRAASPEQLTGRPSPYHSAVTLFEPPSDSVRRSKRIKVKQETEIVSLTEVASTAHVHAAGSSRQRSKVTGKVEESESADTVRGEPEPEVGRSIPHASRSPKKKKVKPVQQSLAAPHPPPPRWKEAYEAIRAMRAHIVAPVDTMGCDQAKHKETEPKNKRFATLVSLMLSSQTKDEVTDAAVDKLRVSLGGALSVQAMLDASDATISEAIAKVGFWRRKTQYLKQTAQKLRADFDSDVPKTVDELCSLPGVGPKMAFLCLHAAWDINVGIGVDVHVHRITNRLGWHEPATKTPEETRLNLQSWLPKELHSEINHMLVGFGQMICVPVGPRCSSCDLSDGLCPSAGKGTKKAKMKREKVVAKVDAPRSSGGPDITIAIEQEETKVKVET